MTSQSIDRKTAKEFLRDFLKIAPLSHALWRSTEALSFSQVNYATPVLDLGCGFGEFSGVVFGQIEMGIDINFSELKKALEGRKYKKVRLADARKLPFKNNSYSTVISVSVFEHIEKSEKVISEVNRILKKDGLFVFSVVTKEINKHFLLVYILNFLGLDRLVNRYCDLHSRAFKHVNLKSSAWWTRELKKANFEIVSQKGTISPTLLRLHEFFLISAFPSQFWKLFFGKRLIISTGLRSRLLPIFFSRFVKTKRDSKINVFFVARKK